MQLFRTKIYKKESLPPEAKDHKLVGTYQQFRELHISGDLLIIYSVGNNILKLVRIGSHAQLFE